MGDGSPVSFGELLRRFRGHAGLTQEELAERSGLSVDAVGLLERGLRQRPQRVTITRLTAALALTRDQAAQLEAAARSSTAPLGNPMPARCRRRAWRLSAAAWRLPRSWNCCAGRMSAC